MMDACWILEMELLSLVSWVPSARYRQISGPGDVPNLDVTPEPGRLACGVCVVSYSSGLCTSTGIKTRQRSVWQYEFHLHKQLENWSIAVDKVTRAFEKQMQNQSTELDIFQWTALESYVQGPNSWSSRAKT